jgi:GNAT superfamily N-acetyltransferase
MSKPFLIQPVTYHDVTTLANIMVEAMSNDRHTQLKTLGDVSYTRAAGNIEDLLSGIKHPKTVYVKAVHGETGDILGCISLWYVGFQEQDVPHTDPAEGWEGSLEDLEEQGRAGGEKRNVDERAKKLIDDLDAWEGADMKRWQDVLMPEGSKCIIITRLQVALAAQGKGVGTALVKWSTDEADKHGVYMWVHSSEAYRVYEKSGFDTVGTLDVDMDAYAPAPPPEGGKWGHYLIRYMKRPAVPSQ